MDRQEMIKVVDSLLKQAEKAKVSYDALQYSQAALNAANAIAKIVSEVDR